MKAGQVARSEAGQAKLRTESGQAIVEYILLLAVIVMVFLAIGRGLGKIGVVGQLSKPLQQDFARTYQYGHPKAKGFDDGGPEYHPRAVVGGKTRVFINPSTTDSGGTE